jgi:Holliday junction resolvase RusA-like endonuclease
MEPLAFQVMLKMAAGTGEYWSLRSKGKTMRSPPCGERIASSVAESKSKRDKQSSEATRVSPHFTWLKSKDFAHDEHVVCLIVGNVVKSIFTHDLDCCSVEQRLLTEQD